MSIITIYHGSSRIIRQPSYGIGKTYNDYGQGFYCTESLELAKEWACTEGLDGYANKYEIDTEGLNILDLSSEGYNILNWLSLLMLNRKMNLSTPIAKKAKEYLIQNFLPESNKYDVIIGYRADDSYFSFARSFMSNEISLKQLEYAMKLGKLGEQFVLKSKKAFDQIKFIDYLISDSKVYYAKRKARDEKARLDFLRELENEDINGIFMRDIMKEGIKANDLHLF